MNTVAIVQRVMPHYRVPLFRGLHAALQAHGIELRLIYGREAPGTVPKTVALDEPWAHEIENSYVRLGARETVWQPCWGIVRDTDLVIVEQANRLLLNFVLLAARAFSRRPRIAFWGHGRSHQPLATTRLSEAIKVRTSSLVDWWFAYTDSSAAVVIANGTSAETLSVVDNAIETEPLARAVAQLGEAELDDLRAGLGIGPAARIGLFCGGMDRGKSLDFLIAAARAIRARIPTFHLILIGDGPDQHIAQRAAYEDPWIHYIGPLFGDQRAPYFRIADIMLIPSEVGLVVVDSFATRTPVFTTQIDNHGPELGYLVHGHNGILAEFDVEAYARHVETYFADAELRERLARGCAESAARYTLANMVERFALGIRRCLDTYR